MLSHSIKLVAMLLPVVSCSTVVAGSDEYWAKNVRIASANCQLVERFSAPKMEGSFCLSTVTLTKTCEGGAEEVSRDAYIAFPMKNDAKCESLRADRDFFSTHAYGGDDYFVNVLRHVARLLREESRAQSEGFSDLGDEVVADLIARQMSAISGLSLSAENEKEIARYKVAFQLPTAKSTVILEIDEDGGSPEWALLMSE